MPIDEPRRKGRAGTEKRTRTNQVNIRFDDAEFAQVDEAAIRAGLTLPSWGRDRMLSAPAARSVRRPPYEKELLAKILGQLGKIGSNVNQLAFAANTTGADMIDVNAAMWEVQQAARMVMAALGRES